MGKLSKKDKRLLFFIVAGLIGCIVLIGLIVRMCTYNPYLRDDYQTHVKLAKRSTVVVELPAGVIGGFSQDECITQTWDNYVQQCSCVTPTEEMLCVERDRLQSKYRDDYNSLGKPSGISFEDWIMNTYGYDSTLFNQTLDITATHIARRNLVSYAYCATYDVDLSDSGYASYLQSSVKASQGNGQDDVYASLYDSYVQAMAAEHLYNSITAR